MSNLFKIPRTKFHRTDARWALVRKHGTSRRKMVDFICGIGGYSAGHGRRFAIEFSISAWAANLDADTLWKRLCEQDEHAGISELSERDRAIARHLWDARHKVLEKSGYLFSDACSEAFNSWTDGYQETFAGGPIERAYSVEGRSGKHLCIESVHGVYIRGTEDDLRERLEAKECGEYVIGISLVKDLFILCVQMSVEITPKAVGETVEYEAALLLWYGYIAQELREVVEDKNIKDALGAHATAIRSTLADEEQQKAFTQICLLAGVPIEKE